MTVSGGGRWAVGLLEIDRHRVTTGGGKTVERAAAMSALRVLEGPGCSVGQTN